jgi:NADP-dependent 3-hydroxy acid dehydrogenase YdfG
VPRCCHLLVNNAGLAIGRQSIAESDVSNFQAMYDTNVLGTLRMTKALIPKLIASADGHVINVISIAGSEVYDNGAGYTSSKHAQRALSETMRLEFHGKPVRVTDVSPGAVETEFSVVRFAGDAQAAKKVYDGFTPLTADDVAEVIAFAATRPKHVNLDRIVMKPVAQATTMRYDRSGTL